MGKQFILTVLIFCVVLGYANPDGKTKINIILKEQANATELMRTASIFPNKTVWCRRSAHYGS